MSGVAALADTACMGRRAGEMRAAWFSEVEVMEDVERELATSSGDRQTDRQRSVDFVDKHSSG